jgi:hypothetical protein
MLQDGVVMRGTLDGIHIKSRLERPIQVNGTEPERRDPDCHGWVTRNG